MEKKKKSQQPYIHQELDEGWWRSVLTESEVEVQAKRILEDSCEDGTPVDVMFISNQLKMTDVNWKNIFELLDKETPVKCEVVGHNQGGLLVDMDDFQGFVPISHLVEVDQTTDMDGREICLSPFVGKFLVLKVIECDPRRGRVVLSERAAQSAPGERHRLLTTLQEGSKLNGCITNITNFGVFVDLGGIEGLVHISELSWGRVNHPSEVANLGETIQVVVVQVDCERSRVALSIKRLIPNPWKDANDRYKEGKRYPATVTQIVPFGAFARLEEGLEGLIHISEMGIEVKVVNPWNILEENQEVKVRVLKVDAERQRLSLHLENQRTQ